MRIKATRIARWGARLLPGYLGLAWTMAYLLTDERSRRILPIAQTLVFPFLYHLNPIRALNQLFPGRHLAFIEFALILSALFLGYTCVIRAARLRQTPMTLRAILLWTAAFCLPLLLVPPDFLSTDVYAYIMEIRVGVVHHANPMVVPPGAFPGDPLLKYVTSWKDLPAIYGPAWAVLLSALTYPLRPLGDAPWLYLAAYKLLAAGFHLANAAMIWRLLGAWKPEQQVWGTLLYAWNPLALLEYAGSAHNDAPMIFFLLLALWLAQQGRWRLATAGLALGALIKYIPLLVLPLYAGVVLRGHPTWPARLKTAGQMAAISLLLAVVFFAPFWQGGRVVRPLLAQPAADRSLNSIAMLATRAWPVLTNLVDLGDDLDQAARDPNLPDEMGLSPQQLAVSQAVRWLGRAALAFTWLAMLIAVWRRPTFERFVWASFWVLLIYIVLGTTWFWPWYTILPLSLAALLDWRPAGRLALAFTATAWIIYGWLGTAWLALAFAPVFALALTQLWRVIAQTRRLQPHGGGR